MAEGIITKALSGFYYVRDSEDQLIYKCRGRGILKKKNISPLVGDKVVFTKTANQEGAIDDVTDRKNEFFRPKVANIDQAILVFTLAEPAWNQHLLDRFLVMAELAGVESVIVINKGDLLDDDLSEQLEGIKILYVDKLNYDLIVVSASDGSGREELVDILANNISMFAGQSGVGKSSIANLLIPGLDLKANEISSKLGRGKHTTRHVELFELAEGGYIVDTPGFGQIDLTLIEDVPSLAACFREIARASADCKYRGCTHMVEDGCQVLAQVESGEITESRYKHYAELLDEIRDYQAKKY